MFGLAVLVVMVLYLSLLFWATKSGWRWGIKKKGWTGKKRYLGAMIGFLIVYLPVFWDWLPTVALHQYYCSKESGFWIYKTLNQWKDENPGVIENLERIPPRQYLTKTQHTFLGTRVDQYLLPNDLNLDAYYDGRNQLTFVIIKKNGNQEGYWLNQRFNWVSENIPSRILDNLTRHEEIIMDSKDNTEIARLVNYGSHGSKSGLDFWMFIKGCPNANNDASKFQDIVNQIKLATHE